MFFVLAWAGSVAEAQRFPRLAPVVRPLSSCPGGVCPAPTVSVVETYYWAPEVVYSAPLVVKTDAKTEAKTNAAALGWFEKLTSAPSHHVSAEEEKLVRSWAKRAVRIINGNSCGSGSLCGRDASGIYILTNAHVAGTRIGGTVQVEALLADGSGTEKFTARVIEAAYSSRTSTDWSLLKADARFMAGLEPIRLSKDPPDATSTGTWGCPRCEVPSGQVVDTVNLGSVWYWQPNSIGGQSGSAVVQHGVQKGLLTWTISGNGAGQQTAIIYSQSTKQNTDGPARVNDMIPVGGPLPGVVCEEGYHSESSIKDYPIWDEDGVDPVPDDPNGPICPDLDDDERRFIDKLRIFKRDRAYDWAKIISLILQLIEAFASK